MLLLFEDLVQEKVVAVKARDEDKFDDEPWMLGDGHPLRKKRAAENKNGKCRRHGDAIPKSSLHDFKLFLKNVFFDFGFCLSFGEINKKPRHVEESGKPGDDRNNV